MTSIPQELSKRADANRIEDVRKQVERFDKAIKSCSEALGPQFSAYPNGSCGAASEVLAEFLFSQGFGVFAYVSGRDSERSHAWLEQDGLLVDITAGQFCDAPEAIVVTETTSWHDRFEARHTVANGSFKSWGDQAAESAAAYQIILRHLK